MNVYFSLPWSSLALRLRSDWLKSFQTRSCWAYSVWLGTLHRAAKECMSRTHKTSSPSHSHTSCSFPPWCPWELSSCLGATVSACCLAHCCVLAGCHRVCWSRRVGCLQMAQQMETCFSTSVCLWVWVSFQLGVCLCWVQLSSFDKSLPMLLWNGGIYEAIFSSSTDLCGPLNFTLPRDFWRSALSRFYVKACSDRRTVVDELHGH